MRASDTVKRALVMALALVLITVPTWAAERPAGSPVDNTITALVRDDKIADLAASLDYDVERIFRFVADEIRYEPYVGILRGADGTLESRAGNSVDQASLLARLLDESLVTYRFASGPIDGSAAMRLAAETRLQIGDAESFAVAVLSADLDQALEDAGREANSEEPANEHVFPDDQLPGAAEQRLRDTVSTIETALAGAGIDLPVLDEVQLPASEVERHTWIQVASGADWLDLDPSISGEDTDTAIALLADTFEELPAELRHIVEFVVLAERWQGGRLETQPILEYSGFADDLAGAQITFGHIPPTGPERLGLVISGLVGSGGLRYHPFLEVGNGAIVSEVAVTFGLGAEEGGSNLLGGSELFRSETPSSRPAAVPDGESTAEWLEVRITRPGHEPVTARRLVFDRFSAAQRDGGEPDIDDLAALEPVDIDGSGSLEFLPLLGVETFAVATGTTKVADVIGRALDEQATIPGVLSLAYHSLRDLLAADVVLGGGLRTYATGPNVVSASVGLDQLGPEVVTALRLDIWHRDIGTLPVDGGLEPFGHPAVVAGALSHVTERAAFNPSESPTGEGGPAEPSVGSMFEAAAQTGIPTVVLSPGTEEKPRYGPRADALITEALSSGKAVIIPADTIPIDGRERVGWWTVDPVTGATTDVMDDGSGTEALEHLGQVSWVLRISGCIMLFSPPIAGYFGRESAGAGDQAGADSAYAMGTLAFIMNVILSLVRTELSAAPAKVCFGKL